jgi:hypothetical protein
MKIKVRVLTVLFACVCSAGVLSAATLSDLISSGGSLTVGDKVFDHFGWSSLDVLASGISVTTIGNGTANNLYGIKIDFNGNFTVSGGLADGDLTYAVHTTGGALISDLHTTVNVTGVGFVDVSELASDKQDQGTSSFVLPLVVADGFSGNSQLEGSIDIPPSGTVWINKDIMLWGSSQINDIEQQFSQVPDSASTLGLLGLALAGVESVRRGYRKLV